MHTWVPVPLPWGWATGTPLSPQLFMTHLPINQSPPSSVHSHKTKLCVCCRGLWEGGNLAKPLGNKRGLVPCSWGGGETSVGEEEKESPDPRESWKGGGGVVFAWIFQVIKFQSCSCLLYVFIFRLVRGSDAWVPAPPSISFSFFLGLPLSQVQLR